MSTVSPASGLRERKNARTRAAIERAALELALDRGFEHTTVDEIAARAEVSPRTVFGRYPTKESIVFGDEAQLAAAFDASFGGDGDLAERLVAFVAEVVENARQDALAHLRLRAMLTDPYLRRGLRGRLDAFEQAIAERVTGELGTAAGDVRVRAFAASVSGLVLAIVERTFAAPAGAPATDPAADLAAGRAFLRAGLAQLRPAGVSPSGADRPT